MSEAVSHGPTPAEQAIHALFDAAWADPQKRELLRAAVDGLRDAPRLPDTDEGMRARLDALS